MATHGGKREGAGRPAGLRNKATLERKASLTDLAQTHAAAAVQTLFSIMSNEAEAASARVAAANAILDRGFGRPRQAVDLGADDESSVTEISLRIVKANGDA
jgi:hypothetical protein